MPIHVDDLLIALNSKSELATVKSELIANFKIHDQRPTKSILGIKIEWDRQVQSISLSQPGYIESMLEQFSMQSGAHPNGPRPETVCQNVTRYI